MGESKIITKPNGELFNPDLAQRAITFINMLKHTKGEWHGKNFDLLPWQTKIISDVFGIVKPNGYRQYNTAYVEIPKNRASPNSPPLSHFISLRVTASGVLKYMDVQPTDNRRRLFSMSLVRW